MLECKNCKTEVDPDELECYKCQSTYELEFKEWWEEIGKGYAGIDHIEQLAERAFEVGWKMGCLDG